jgi:site-specific DNA recombinase
MATRAVPGKPGELSIDEAEAAIVRRIFAEFIAGRTPRAIAAALNADGVPPPRGERWNASTINGNTARGHGMLLNALYAGTIVWNKVRMIKDPATGKRVSRPNPPALHGAAPRRRSCASSTTRPGRRRRRIKATRSHAGATRSRKRRGRCQDCCAADPAAAA